MPMPSSSFSLLLWPDGAAPPPPAPAIGEGRLRGTPLLFVTGFETGEPAGTAVATAFGLASTASGTAVTSAEVARVRRLLRLLAAGATGIATTAVVAGFATGVKPETKGVAAAAGASATEVSASGVKVASVPGPVSAGRGVGVKGSRFDGWSGAGVKVLRAGTGVA